MALDSGCPAVTTGDAYTTGDTCNLLNGTDDSTGNTVYGEGNGSLYNAGATIDGDSRTASLNMLKARLGM